MNFASPLNGTFTLLMTVNFSSPLNGSQLNFQLRSCTHWLPEHFIITYCMKVNLAKSWSVTCDGPHEAILHPGREGEVREGARGKNAPKTHCVIKSLNCYKVWDHMYSTV